MDGHDQVQGAHLVFELVEQRQGHHVLPYFQLGEEVLLLGVGLPLGQHIELLIQVIKEIHFDAGEFGHEVFVHEVPVTGQSELEEVVLLVDLALEDAGVVDVGFFRVGPEHHHLQVGVEVLLVLVLQLVEVVELVGHQLEVVHFEGVGGGAGVLGLGIGGVAQDALAVPVLADAALLAAGLALAQGVCEVPEAALVDGGVDLLLLFGHTGQVEVDLVVLESQGVGLVVVGVVGVLLVQGTVLDGIDLLGGVGGLVFGGVVLLGGFDLGYLFGPFPLESQGVFMG